MARAHRPFLDRPSARIVAALVVLGCVAALVYLERERLWRATADQASADDPFVRCFTERAAQVDRMLAEGVIEAAQAELFKARAEAMCRAETQGEGDPTPSRPVE